MFVYYLFFAILILAGLGMRELTAKQFKKPIGTVTYLFGVIVLMFLMLGLRDINTGVDTRSYVDFFMHVTLYGFEDKLEPIYVIYTYTINMISDNYHIYLMAMAVPYCISIYVLMRRYLKTSDEVMIGVLVLFVFGIYHFSAAAMRQTVALGMGVLAFIEVDKGNWKKYLIWIAIGMGFHNSAFILLALYPLKYLNLGKYGILIVAAFYAVSLIIPKDFMMQLQLLQSSTDELRYSQYGSSYESELSLAGFYLQLIPLILIYIRRDHLPLKERTKNLFLNCAYLGTGFQALVVVVGEFYRVSFYFAVFDIVLIPLALSCLSKRYSTIAKILFVVGCLVYLLFIGTSGALPIPNTKTSNFS